MKLELLKAFVTYIPIGMYFGYVQYNLEQKMKSYHDLQMSTIQANMGAKKTKLIPSYDRPQDIEYMPIQESGIK